MCAGSYEQTARSPKTLPHPLRLGNDALFLRHPQAAQ